MYCLSDLTLTPVLAQRLSISQSYVSAMELDPDPIGLEQLLTLVAALHHEVLVQPKQAGSGDSVATHDWSPWEAPRTPGR